MIIAVTFLVLIAITYFFIIILSIFKSSPVVSGDKKIFRHGHRCFADGLNFSEKKVVDLLSHGLSHIDYFIFNNLIIPSTHSKSTQIDHVIVSRFGIFVIETKECNGWVFVNPTNKNWTLTYPAGKKYQLANPLWQNHGHVMTLEKLLPFAADSIFSIVVFTGDTKFKTDYPENVLRDTDLIEKIKSYNNPVLSQQRLLMAIGKLSYMCQAIEISPEQHISNIENVLNEKKAPAGTAGAQ